MNSDENLNSIIKKNGNDLIPLCWHLKIGLILSAEWKKIDISFVQEINLHRITHYSDNILIFEIPSRKTTWFPNIS